LKSLLSFIALQPNVYGTFKLSVVCKSGKEIKEFFVFYYATSSLDVRGEKKRKARWRTCSSEEALHKLAVRSRSDKLLKLCRRSRNSWRVLWDEVSTF